MLRAQEMQAGLEAERGEQARYRYLTAPRLTAHQLAVPITGSPPNRHRQVAALYAEWAAKLAAVSSEARAQKQELTSVKIELISVKRQRDQLQQDQRAAAV